MRVQHNIASMNSYRNYNNNTRSINKNLEKLSSGYKINRAGDDAAGLAISEKMRAQITGLEGAQKNAKDGISLVQTAEGALTEVHSMLNRMVQLAEQSANGTYSEELDREQLQKEVDQLRTEINRIADSSNFNGIKLLDGSMSGSGSSISSTVKLGENITGQKITAVKGKFSFPAATISTLPMHDASGITGYSADSARTMKVTLSYSDGVEGKSKSLSVTLANRAKDDGTGYVLVGSSGKEYSIAATTGNPVAAEVISALKQELSNTALADKFDITEASNTFTFEARDSGTSGATLLAVDAYLYNEKGVQTVDDLKAHANMAVTTVTKAANEGMSIAAPSDTAGAGGIQTYDGTNADTAIFTINGKKFALLKSDITDDLASGLDKSITILGKAASTPAWTQDMVNEISQKTGLDISIDSGKLILRAGTSSSGSGGLQLQIGDTSDDFNRMRVSINDIHARSLGIGSIDISTQDGAASAMDEIKEAINYVSDVRGTLGATQNRLEHTINNLSVMQENIQDAESTIRDTDVADEMMKYTKNSILVQSAQAMLAQANQQPQGVLQLLQ